MPTPDQRHAALTHDYPAVAAIDLTGAVALVARRADGTIGAVEVVDFDGAVLDADAAQELLASERRRAELALQRTTEALIAHLALRSARGDDVNLTRVAAQSGLARQTLYNRLDAIAPAEPASA